MCVCALCDFCPYAPWGGMAPCWLVHRAHLLYDNYPRHPSAQQGSYLPLRGHTVQTHTHTHIILPLLATAGWGSLYSLITIRTPSHTRTPLRCCYRWDEPPGTCSPALGCCGVFYWWRISEWEREITWASLCAGRQGVAHVFTLCVFFFFFL